MRFEAVVEPHRSELRTYARRLAGDDADDVVQDAFLRAWRAWGRFDVTKGTIRAWLYRIVFNAFVNRYHRRRVRNAQPDLVRDALYDAAPAPDPTFGDEVSTALRYLPPRWRAMIELDATGATYREIAETLKIPAGSVMSGLARARAELEIALAKFARETYGIRRREPRKSGRPAMRSARKHTPLLKASEHVQADADGIDRVVRSRNQR